MAHHNVLYIQVKFRNQTSKTKIEGAQEQIELKKRERSFERIHAASNLDVLRPTLALALSGKPIPTGVLEAFHSWTMLVMFFNAEIGK